ncbi:hypothetical protein Zmor_003010 [Zophobas morio]|uniref:PHD-type domain-containing protein n=1 Tax=Zophobas morio TaxID=2755281 RepID=A0AA38M0Z8_9CUCU|nr:hypothetical protein Zmor_003010 [Zophobas morio]
MPNFCLSCNSAITPTTPSIKCNGFCKKYCHIKCSSLTDAEVTDVIKNSSTWSCGKCTQTKTNNEQPNHSITAEVIESIMAKQLELLKKELQQSMDDHFRQLNDRIATVENNVKIIQDEWAEFKNNNNNSVENSEINLNNVVSEIEERKQRSCNVMLFNIPESTAAELAGRVAEDLQKVMSILTPLGTFPQPNKMIRLGSKKPNVKRPLKIIYDSETAAREILRSNKSNPNREYHFRPDLTVLQRDYNNRVRKEYLDRTANGESDIVLKYKNNCPFIAKQNVKGGPSKK